MSPFRSKAQMRKFAALVERGQMSQQTFDRWKEETPNIGDLPEKIDYAARKRKRAVARLAAKAVRVRRRRMRK